MVASTHLSILVGGQAVPITVRRRRKTGYLRLRLNSRNEAVVSAPRHCSDRAVLQFVDQHRAWLAQQLAGLPQLRTLDDWLAAHPQLSAGGDCFAVRVESSARMYADYVFEQGGAVIVLRLPEPCACVDAALIRLVRRFAKDVLTCRLAYHAKRLNLSAPGLSVRDQATRWGSCSTRGAISLNWRLVLIPPELQDSIMLHELAHLTEMNHSSRFWDLLDQYDPNRRAHAAALNAITAEVMRVGRLRII